ncbi:DUF5107 domain-containing protein [Opitutaceae bacterium EW11]|nr:DUF5107 domain-containing protein [Opitutaceae bacterium EW11]
MVVREPGPTPVLSAGLPGPSPSSSRPFTMATNSVQVRRKPVVFPTYEPLPPDKNPMYLERRVYQGSNGGVYPLPFTDRIAERPTPRSWDAVHLENEFIRVMILPELGGRIHVGQDKTNGYDFFYRQDVIKPALVGLAGPWISGGVEFNWPQHHRPSTFMPADVEIERHRDGSVTVWLSEHDPMARMKGMHGVCLHPGRAVIELRARVYNRTPFVQTFLWWANVATRVHERYQSFFPEDITAVADHAKRAMSRFPLATGRYYGVNYGERAKRGVPESEKPRQFVPPGDYAANDLSWYANIPVPTSYMALGSEADFFGGYDHAAKAGVVHVANHHIAPGKKQWTWGNQEFGYAWDRNLTDAGADGVHAPYIELMAGVYTDNQPDFSFLQPGETKTWSQYWYPIQQIGPAQKANVDAAVSLRVEAHTARIGVSAARVLQKARIVLTSRDHDIARFTRDLKPGTPVVASFRLPGETRPSDLTLRVLDDGGREIIAYSPPPPADAPDAAELARQAASEPAAPGKIASTDELYVTGLHLEQYRHATRCPTDYWREALRRDPGDSRCHTALGKWHLRRGEFADAEAHFRSAIARLTLRNPNPADGEAHYHLGLTLRYLGWMEQGRAARAVERRFADAYAALYKSTWNQAWAGAAYHALAEIDCSRGDWTTALDHLDRSLRFGSDNLRARDLRAVVLRNLSRSAEATECLRQVLALDPLDWWARCLLGEKLACDNQVRLDLAHDCIRAGLFDDALKILDTVPQSSKSPADLGTAPLLAYTAAWCCALAGDGAAAQRRLAGARKASPDYCFPARLEEGLVFSNALALVPQDSRAALYLGHWLYHRRRHGEAIAQWEQAARRDEDNAVAWRCLGIGYFNVNRDPARASSAYERAVRANPKDARLLYERDQLWKRMGVSAGERLSALERHPKLVAQRDDLTVEICALYNQTGRPGKALALLTTRRFQPWEGGEGQALGQHVRTHLGLGRSALSRGDAQAAIEHFTAAAGAPENLGEAKHLLANQSDIHFWLGEALAAAGRVDDARAHWSAAAEFKGDFQEMQVRSFSEMTYFSGLALCRLGRAGEARRLFKQLVAHARELARQPAKIDYFATSLPTMLLFDDDLQARQETNALFMEAQARLGLGEKAAARRLLRKVLERDPSHALAADLVGGPPAAA